MLKEELEIIYYNFKALFKGGNTLEIGAYKGMTSYLICGIRNEYKGEITGKHYIVDLFENGKEDWDWAYEPYSEDLIKQNLKEYEGLFETIKGRSLDYDTIDKVLKNKYDFIFIDGDHRYPTLLLELNMADFVTEFIFGHDYGHQGVTNAVNQFCLQRKYQVQKLDARYGLFTIIK